MIENEILTGVDPDDMLLANSPWQTDQKGVRGSVQIALVIRKV
jgi:hypothetical protein